jgi:hypothetical protein
MAEIIATKLRRRVKSGVKKMFTVARKNNLWVFQVYTEDKMVYESQPNIFLIMIQEMKSSIVRYMRTTL